MNKQMNWTNLTEKQKELQFSGSIYVRKNGIELISDGFGHAIRSEKNKKINHKLVFPLRLVAKSLRLLPFVS